MRNRSRPSTVHVHARVCTCSALIRGRGRTDASANRPLTVTSEGSNTMNRYQPEDCVVADLPERR
jgi:hypothetical protein